MLRHHLTPNSPWQVASAGTCAISGDEASPGAIEVLAESLLDLTGHRSQPLTDELARAATVIVALTRAHRDDILAAFPSAFQKVFLLRSFDPHTDSDKDIADPIGGTLDVYRRCRDAIATAIPGLAEFLSEIKPGICG